LVFSALVKLDDLGSAVCLCPPHRLARAFLREQEASGSCDRHDRNVAFTVDPPAAMIECGDRSPQLLLIDNAPSQSLQEIYAFGERR